MYNCGQGYVTILIHLTSSLPFGVIIKEFQSSVISIMTLEISAIYRSKNAGNTAVADDEIGSETIFPADRLQLSNGSQYPCSNSSMVGLRHIVPLPLLH